jgi:hypothetical protein
VYAMVTLSPTLGTGPLPSLIIVLVTPMIAAVREKLRGVDVESVLILVRSVVRSLGKEENIEMEFSGKEGRRNGPALLMWFGGRLKSVAGYIHIERARYFFCPTGVVSAWRLALEKLLSYSCLCLHSYIGLTYWATHQRQASLTSSPTPLGGIAVLL